MGHVAVTVNGRTYRLQCDAGDEQRLIELATHVGHHVDGLAVEFGAIGDEHLLLMAALLVADELWDARERLARLEAAEAGRRLPPPLPAPAAES